MLVYIQGVLLGIYSLDECTWLFFLFHLDSIFSFIKEHNAEKFAVNECQIAVIGYGYGGFVALHALRREIAPCGIAVAPISDLKYLGRCNQGVWEKEVQQCNSATAKQCNSATVSVSCVHTILLFIFHIHSRHRYTQNLVFRPSQNVIVESYWCVKF